MISRTRSFPAPGLAGVGAAFIVLTWCFAGTTPTPGQSGSRPVIDFDRDIHPILSENCFQCHGPDEKQRKAKLRLDVRADLLKHGSVVVPGKAAESELIERVTAGDPKTHMPPAKTGKRLTAKQVDLLRRWIDEGAKWSAHWAFVKPKRPALPEVKDRSWPRNGIDFFILARLEREGLRPSPEAGKETLIRRVTLDLTGLPPSPAEVDAFLADSRPDAYERVVDRLLGSPRYGERMAQEWLDAARFADTHGYHLDSGRDMTRWRDWVIRAFNRNLPFDRFTVEQLAGDLLPQATLDQRIASGFNRNHMINFEGGAIPEEYHAAYIVDRVNTTGTVWLGLTVGCCQCHDHKYDPMTQKEFYQLYAFFNNVPENGLDGSRGNATPMLKVPTPEEQKELDQLAAEIAERQRRLDRPLPSVDAAQAEWEKTAAARTPVAWEVLDPAEYKSQGGATLTKLPDRSILAGGTNPVSETYTVTGPSPLAQVTAVRLEALPQDGLVAKGPGRSENGNIVLTDVRLTVDGRALKLKAASADFSQDGYPVAHAIDGNPTTGWAVFPEVGKPHAAVFEPEATVRGRGARLTVTLDFRSQFPQHQLGRFRLSVTNSQTPHGTGALPLNIEAALAIPAGKRTDGQKAELRTYYRTKVSPEVRRLSEELAGLRREQAELDQRIPTTMVMQDMPMPRDTFLLVRGQYDKKGEKVRAGVPAFLPPLPEGAAANRLGLTRWLVGPDNPLTARVIVNRYWQMYFGTGLVKTAEDFGSQGERPSHPELLDWLATGFVSPSPQPSPQRGEGENGQPSPQRGEEASRGPSPNRGEGKAWDVKAIQRLIVTSATYRQSSAASPALLAKDPENRLLARMARLRLPAEFIRDQALAVSGLLDGRVGGKSVSPYQPTGLWEELTSRQDSKNWTAQTFVQSHGKDLYRRGMYTFWKRTSPPPSLSTFDAPDRETCTVRRARTNTPLQALVLMNDPTFVEASRKLAERMMTEAASPEDRVALAWRLVTGRKPTAAETAVLENVFERQLAVYRKDKQAALKLLATGEARWNEKLDPAELAAWAMVANVILNLDEAVTRG